MPYNDFRGKYTGSIRTNPFGEDQQLDERNDKQADGQEDQMIDIQILQKNIQKC